MQYCFTNRFGGISQAPYENFNLGLHVNDNPSHVEHNRRLLKAQCNVPHIMFMNQVHSADVTVISGIMPVPTCDAMITNQKGIALAVMVADCIPILLYDSVNEAIGVVHAGRTGSALHVGTRCIQKMHQVYGTEAKDIKLWMGPSIGGCCYEVGKDVTVGLEDCLHVRENRYFLDLPSFNKADFLALGVKETNIVHSTICTCCNPDYFSYRRDTITGRFVGVIWL
ncbi:MAG: peptidoglycan editing factor PgeF [Sulfurospirillaceae bacterium]|nr:peptidoglycan editing factor PgeF [Sulfurospirillaceae bacterium]MDD2826293.1 peptidoglycan editing factor PgeF [Sulfurospirillaceae bacterium]